MSEEFEPEPEPDPEIDYTEKDKLELKDIKSLDVWNIIETYFRDNPNYKSQHQIDSFDEFITSEENGIRQIIKRNNPLSIFKGEKSDKNFSYEMEIYFGETLDEASGEVMDSIDNIFITSPIAF